VQKEEFQLTELIRTMSEEVKAGLDDRITLRTDVPYHPEASAIYPMQHSVPKKIRLMSKYIDKFLKANPEATEIVFTSDGSSGTLSGIDSKMLSLVLNYCEAFYFIKVRSTISFPAPFNIFEQNVCSIEAQAMRLIEENKIYVADQAQAPNLYKFNELKRLLVICKKLEIESLYQLTACAIACFFKSESSLDFPDSKASEEYLHRHFQDCPPQVEKQNQQRLRTNMPYVFK
jgi:hypothetical protein